MLRSARLVMMVLLAMFIVAVPTAAAQSPVSDQYSTSDDPGATSAGGGGAAQGDGSGGNGTGAAPVQVRDLTAAQGKALPFTGGQISLIALIGLALLALGTAGIASTRRRASATAP